MKFIKKQTISTVITLIALVFAIVSIILFSINSKDSAAQGLFNFTSVDSTLMAESVLEIVFLALILALSEFKIGGLIGSIEEWLIWAIKIIVCVLPVLALIGFLSLRVQGLANLYFSDENIQATMQATPGYMEAASLAIKSAVMYGVTAVLACVAAFFRPYKKVKKEASLEQAA
ncbi:MAG: hypothetical protein LUD50_01380 [Clostridia bacterium]|nr:hypothetical protein [Clostridia bacterium]